MESSKLVALRRKRGSVKGRMTRLVTFVTEINETTSIDEIRIRLAAATTLMSEFNEIEERIFIESSLETSDMADFEVDYYKVVTELSKALRRLTGVRVDISADVNETLNNTIHGGNEFKLPKANIPPFDGNYKDWQSFDDLYRKAIHENTVLSAAQKFQYLKGLLRGDAAKLVQHLSITEANYFEAYQKLCNRYDKKKHIVSTFIQTFMEQPAVKVANASTMRNLSDTCDEVLRGLKALGPLYETRDPWLIYIITNKLDADTRQRWADHSADIQNPTIQNLCDFLSNRADAYEIYNKPASINRNPASKYNTQSTVKLMHIQPSEYCKLCSDGSHPLYTCKRFIEMNVEDRRKLVKEKQLCYNCLGSSHAISKCRSTRKCSTCQKRHHTLLHFKATADVDTSIVQPSKVSLHAPITIEANKKTRVIPTTLLPTAQVLVMGSNGEFRQCRALLDSGSQGSFISETCVQRLQLVRKNARVTVSGIASTPAAVSRGLTNILVASRYDETQQISFNVLILNKITSTLPAKEIDVNNWTAVHGLDLADPQFFNPNGIDLLIGADQFFRILLPDIKRIAGLPTALKTMFGWVLAGEVHADNQLNNIATLYSEITPSEAFNTNETQFQIHNIANLYSGITPNEAFNAEEIRCENHVLQSYRRHSSGQSNERLSHRNGTVTLGEFASVNSDINIDQTLRKFWEIEEAAPREALTAEEINCENHFLQSYCRHANGQFEVQLPFKNVDVTLGETMSLAVARLKAMERKFRNNCDLKQAYVNFMKEYETLGHMEPIPDDMLRMDNDKHCYLPHHGIIKQASTTTKLRVVFDASAKSRSGTSLNDLLMVGPTIQPSLLSIIMRFRMHAIVFIADIEKMYRQIRMNLKDVNFQRIVWREHESDPIKHYRLLTVTYGTASAPYLATRVLKQISMDINDKKLSRIIAEDFYVDDLMTGTDDLESALTTQTKLIETLNNAGFSLRKWASNNEALCTHLPMADRASNSISLDADRTIKVLGLEWNPQEDTFTFKINLDSEVSRTKRHILSESARVFDPLGWLAPTVVKIKILLQRLWLMKLNWDDELPHEMLNEWTSFRNQLPILERISIRRWLQTKNQQFQLHGFCDASEDAYAAAVYVRLEQPDKSFSVNLLAAKTKVAPVQQISIPKLELNAAVLLSKLLNSTVETLNLKECEVYAWTDSTIVLNWIASHPRRWKTFVANRVAEIHNLTSRFHWLHVRSNDNPADCASRGINPDELASLTLWWHGPAWLSQIVSLEKTSELPTDELLEDITKEEKSKSVITHATELKFETIDEFVEKLSSFYRMTKSLSWMLRFIRNCRLKHKDQLEDNHKSKLLTVMEINQAETQLFKWIQQSEFSKEISSLNGGKPVHSTSKIVTLNPFLDRNGILRVGGRIKNSIASYETKYPIILPHSHNLVKTMVREEHIKQCHAGVTLLFNILRQKFWIVRCKDVVRKVIHDCVICVRHKQSLAKQLMGDLPKGRVQYHRPFLRTGVDYAGPVMVKPSLLRGKAQHKAYIAIFVCFSTKAVHFELVTSLTTDSFIGALQRFIARRGLCAQLHSDRGTNFIGANRNLKELFEFLESHHKEIYQHLLQDKIQWHFNPPSAPHFGGLFESAVKSMKFHLNRVLGQTILTYEEMTTLLAKIESILNSRPICQMSSDVIDALTPSHFLLGHPSTYLPEADLQHIKMGRLSRWQMVTQMAQHFWTRWHREYLPELQKRNKWRETQNNIKVNDIVVVKDENLPPAKWLIARIIEVHPGADQLVRVVKLQTKNGVLTRPIRKLVLLPVEPEDSRRPECSDRKSNSKDSLSYK